MYNIEWVPRGGLDRALAFLSEGPEFESCLCQLGKVVNKMKAWTHTNGDFTDLGLHQTLSGPTTMGTSANIVTIKGGFYSEGADGFVISSNRQTSLFSWAWILNLWYFNGLKSSQIRV